MTNEELIQAFELVKDYYLQLAQKERRRAKMRFSVENYEQMIYEELDFRLGEIKTEKKLSLDQ